MYPDVCVPSAILSSLEILTQWIPLYPLDTGAIHVPLDWVPVTQLAPTVCALMSPAGPPSSLPPAQLCEPSLIPLPRTPSMDSSLTAQSSTNSFDSLCEWWSGARPCVQAGDPTLSCSDTVDAWWAHSPEKKADEYSAVTIPWGTLSPIGNPWTPSLELEQDAPCPLLQTVFVFVFCYWVV